MLKRKGNNDGGKRREYSRTSGICRSLLNTQDVICITRSPFYAALQVCSSFSSGCIHVLVWLFSFKRKYGLEKKKKREGYPYIIKMEEKWQRTVRSVNGKVHQTTETTSVRLKYPQILFKWPPQLCSLYTNWRGLPFPGL